MLIDELMKACQAWNVSYNALAAAQAALKDQEYIKKIKALTTAGRKYLEDELTKLGCTLAKPCANFIYFDTHHDPKEIRAALAERKIMISAFGFNRVSVGTEEQNQAFIAALKEFWQPTNFLNKNKVYFNYSLLFFPPLYGLEYCKM